MKLNFLKYAIWVGLFLCQLRATAQYAFYNLESFTEIKSDHISRHYYGGEYSSTNDCNVFFDYNNNPNNIVFKKVTTCKYKCNDTTLHDKTLEERTTCFFNKKGQEIMETTQDDDSITTDSAITVYDNEGHKIRGISYDETTKPNATEMYIWDSKGNMVKDTEIRRKDDVSWYDTSHYTIKTIYCSYDGSGNLLRHSAINGKDTAITIYKIDSANRILMREEYDRWLGNAREWAYFTTTKDADSNVTDYMEVLRKDTTDQKYTYSKDHKLLAEHVYENGKLTRTLQVTTQQDNGIIVTDEVKAYDYGNSCPKNTITIYVYGQDSLLKDKTITEDKNGMPFVTTEKHFYRFNERHWVTLDSAVITEKGHLHSSTYIQITMRSWDTVKRVFEVIRRGGSDKGENSKEVFMYNAQRYRTEADEYGACLDQPYSIHKFIYYPDGKTHKEDIVLKGDDKTYTYFGKDERKLSEVEINGKGITQRVYETVYEYEE